MEAPNENPTTKIKYYATFFSTQRCLKIAELRNLFNPYQLCLLKLLAEDRGMTQPPPTYTLVPQDSGLPDDICANSCVCWSIRVSVTVFSHAEPSCCDLILPIIALHPSPTRWKCHQVTHAYLHVAFLSTFTGVCRKMGLSRKYGYQESPWFKISFSQSNSHIAQRNAQFSSIFRHTIIILLLWPHCVPVYPIWTSWFYTPRISLVKIPHFQTDPDHTEIAAASSFRRWRSQQFAYASEPPCIGQAECFWI